MQTLVLTQNRFLAEGAQAMQGATTWTALRALDLANNLIEDEGAKGLVGASWLKQLERLDLAINRLSDSSFAVLAKELPALTWLNLSDNPLGAKAETWVASLPALSHLSIGDETKLTDKSFSKLLEAASPALSSLDLSKSKLGDDSAKAIAESKRAFTSLDISYTKVGVAGTEALVKSPSMQGLQSLIMNCAGATKKIAKLLVDGALPALRQLSIYGEADNDKEALALFKKTPRLAKLFPNGFLDC